MKTKIKQGIRVALIHQCGRVATGAHQLNETLLVALKQIGVTVHTIFPKGKYEIKPNKEILNRRSQSANYINNKIKFYGSLEARKEELRNCDVLHGVTYTGIGLVDSDIPVVASFGSTLYGYLRQVPRRPKLYRPSTGVFRKLEKSGQLYLEELRPRMALKLLSKIEKRVALKSAGNIACSLGVAQELVEMGVPAEKVKIIYNALSPEWLTTPVARSIKKEPEIVFIGRLGRNKFELALKGFDRLIGILDRLPKVTKRLFLASENMNLPDLLCDYIPDVYCYSNVRPHQLIIKLGGVFGDILLLTSRYEGFSLSLIQGMSRGTIPVTFPCGIAPEIIRNGENGYIVNSPAEALRCIRTIQADPILRAKLATNAIKMAKKFTPAKMAKAHLTLYKEIKSKSRH
jgi:glycosyltransferase involved in cell wall biosynthesis